MHKAAVGIVGASGYSGVEATRILAAHPRVELGFVTSERWVGEQVKDRVAGVEGPAGGLRYLKPEAAEALAARCAVVLLATPAEVSLELAPRLVKATRVIDLSGAFRLADAASYPKHYKLEHRQPELLAEAVYGLCELGREPIRAARLLANPGCYATAAALAAAPLVRQGLLVPESLVINAASGVTGAGRKASEDFSFAEVADDYRAYRVLKHQHAPEISQTLTRVGRRPVTPLFTPHLLPLKRGILCTLSAQLGAGVTAAQVTQAYAEFCRDEPFLRLLSGPDEVSLKGVVGTNRCLLGVAVEGDGGRVVVCAAIDNLVKGAAGQAVQNLNLMMGWAETEGLALRGFHP